MDWVNDKMDKWFPFSAGITKQDGTVIAAGEIKRQQLDTMNYYVEGVNGKLN
jgi:hypothetical protein